MSLGKNLKEKIYIIALFKRYTNGNYLYTIKNYFRSYDVDKRKFEEFQETMGGREAILCSC